LPPRRDRSWAGVGVLNGRSVVRPEADRSVAIIGGGVSGITTAILLQLSGYRTALYTTMQPCFEPGAARPPEFATLHAAASVIPHSVASPKLSHWTGISQQFFRALSLPGSCGVRRQLHYEISEDPNEPDPPYAAAVDNFARLTSDEANQPWVPKRSAAGATCGWKFAAFFCEAPQYLRFLYGFYARIGGQIRQPPAVAGLPRYLALDHEVFVNCTGFGTSALLASAGPQCIDDPMLPDFEPLLDPYPGKLVRGHYLRMDIKEILASHRGRLFSYNYKPTADIHRTGSGMAADVYCYQRSDAWVLGGSRQLGSIDERGNWIGEQTIGAELEFACPDAPSLAVPAAIFRLNAEILLRISNGRIDLYRLVRDAPDIVSPGIGYRFLRDSESDNVRVSCSRLQFADERKYILHNYGHGGAGYTLSWGCAFDILQMVGRITQVAPQLAGHGKFSIGDTAIRGLLGSVVTRLLSHEA
jgi:D-amino-acid oxidase